MRKFYVFIICLATLIALFSINNGTKTFSFESYLTELSQVADERPKLPDTKNISDTFSEYEELGTDNSENIVKILKSIWTTIKLIVYAVVFLARFILYILNYIIFLAKLLGTATFNLVVW